MGVPMKGFFDGAEAVLVTPTPSTAAHKAPAKTPTPSAEPVPREGTHVEGVGETIPLPAERPTPSEGAVPPAAVQPKITPFVLPLVISTSDPFTAISHAAKDGASLVVTPSSILGSATHGPDTDLSSEGSDDILEDPDDAPVLKKRISDSDEEGSASPEPDFMETSEGPEIAAGVGMTAPAAPVAPIPAAPSVPVSAVPTTPASTMPIVLVSATPVAPIPGSLPTIPSQFEAGSSSAAISDDAASFLVRFDQPEVNDLGPADF
ncbi:endochitinase A1-like [Quercus robur]|uniref:endochitinase A1-like n=1 Tax=Quercus robur TaxID=38942 RepID=UPI002163A760|nr:endochitinase A1-like [Quercus robur]